MRKIISQFLKDHWAILVVSISVIAYISYFYYFSVLRYKTLYASYFDLGIMQQTVFNTFKSIQTGDWSRFLEMTNPFGADQIKRMAIHNDLILALIAPFYFYHAGPEMLLFIQSFVVGVGGLIVFLLAQFEFRSFRYSKLLAVVFGISFLLYSPLLHATAFDFHAVTLATTFLLVMFYTWFRKKYRLSFLFLILALMCKEEVALTTTVFALYTLYSAYKKEKSKPKEKYYFGIIALILSMSWFFFSVSYMIPLFRGAKHFAISYYSDFGDSPLKVIVGVLTEPLSIFRFLFRKASLYYFIDLFGPLGFIALLSPSSLIAIPEFGINLLSNNTNMQSIAFHYTSVITPFLFIGAIFGIKKILDYVRTRYKKSLEVLATFFVLSFIILFAYWNGPLPFTRDPEIHPFKYPQKERKDAELWADALQKDTLKVSTTGQIAPFFVSRRYYYVFSQEYVRADYVLVRPNEVFDYPEKKILVPIYKRLQKDSNFELIYKKENFEVYKKITVPLP